MTPSFYFADSNQQTWNPLVLEDGRQIIGVELKSLVSANGNHLELYRFEPNISYPDHYHEGPEFVFILEGTLQQNGQWLKPGWSSAAEKGTLDHDAKSGPEGCTLLTVYHQSAYIPPTQ
ncbi:MAG: anti-sigma factor ChrR (cupin superfamily) [Saprospiraceae bacterium]|jgi:anti-sigma factor ChrR (cupin superfamily)